MFMKELCGTVAEQMMKKIKCDESTEEGNDDEEGCMGQQNVKH